MQVTKSPEVNTRSLLQTRAIYTTCPTKQWVSSRWSVERNIIRHKYSVIPKSMGYSNLNPGSPLSNHENLDKLLYLSDPQSPAHGKSSSIKIYPHTPPSLNPYQRVTSSRNPNFHCSPWPNWENPTPQHECLALLIGTESTLKFLWVTEDAGLPPLFSPSYLKGTKTWGPVIT